jgi:hypothetical protein
MYGASSRGLAIGERDMNQANRFLFSVPHEFGSSAVFRLHSYPTRANVLLD